MIRNEVTVRKDRLAAVLFLTTAVLLGCTRSEPRGFSVHLLASDMPATELSTADLNDLDLQEEAIISIEDIIVYSWKTHEIEIAATAYQRIEQLFSLPVEVRGMPFVVCVGSDRIYAGGFWTPASSLSFDGVIILQPSDPDRHVIRIALGYPTPEAFTGKDPRSDRRVLQSLESAGKLR